MSLVIHKHKVKRVIGKTPAGNNKTKTMIAEEVHVMYGEETHCGLNPTAQTAVEHMRGHGPVVTVIAPGAKLMRINPQQLTLSMEVCYICQYWALKLDSTPPDVREALEKHAHLNQCSNSTNRS